MDRVMPCTGIAEADISKLDFRNGSDVIRGFGNSASVIFRIIYKFPEIAQFEAWFQQEIMPPTQEAKEEIAAK